jgi:hypothetical protein
MVEGLEGKRGQVEGGVDEALAGWQNVTVGAIRTDAEIIGDDVFSLSRAGRTSKLSKKSTSSTPHRIKSALFSTISYHH